MILLLSEQKSYGTALSVRLTAGGICTLYAKPDAGELLGDLREIGGVILDGRERPHTAEALCDRLLAAAPAMPIAILLPPAYVCRISTAYLIRTARASREEWNALLDFCVTVCGCAPSLSTFSLSLPCAENATYMGYPLHLSPREYAVLCLLLQRAPSAASSAELLAVAFPEGTQKASNLAVHISHINRRASSILTSPPLIEHIPNIGYRLRSGIVGKE